MTTRREIEVDRWYVPTREDKHKWSPRWVLGVFVNPYDRRDRVLYSNGGDDHYTCLRSTFAAWVGASKAEVKDVKEWDQEVRPEFELSEGPRSRSARAQEPNPPGEAPPETLRQDS